MIEIKVTQQEVNDLIFALEIAIGSGLLDRETRKDLYTLKKTLLVYFWSSFRRNRRRRKVNFN